MLNNFCFHVYVFKSMFIAEAFSRKYLGISNSKSTYLPWFGGIPRKKNYTLCFLHQVLNFTSVCNISHIMWISSVALWKWQWLITNRCSLPTSTPGRTLFILTTAATWTTSSATQTSTRSTTAWWRRWRGELGMCSAAGNNLLKPFELSLCKLVYRVKL